MSKEWKNALKHLRLHFSLLLLPIFLFAVSQVPIYHYGQTFPINTFHLVVTFIVLHLLVYPASNVFNSYYDRDMGSVGGLKNPPPVNRKMLWLANIFDLSALALSYTISIPFTFLVLTYILASRLYSYRPIRLKKYPIIGFLVIFIFQGAFTFNLSLFGLMPKQGCIGPFPPDLFSHHYIWAKMACSFQIGAIYPLTQIYQHKSDLNDGVTTLSYKLGYRGTFIFSGVMFSLATIFYYLHFKEINLNSFYLLIVAQTPIILYFIYWAKLVWQNNENANYKNTMRMNVIAATILNLFLVYLVISK
jgi:1,4-dihydroxy-2-naphthoate octaprenyltransferase